MPVDVVDSRERFHALRANWDRVYAADAEAQVFLSWQWLWHLYERRAGEINILAYRVGASEPTGCGYSAFMPVRSRMHLSKTRERFLLTFRMAGNYWADYTGLVSDPACEAAAAAAFGAYLCTLPWSRLYLDHMKMSDARFEALVRSFDDAGHSRRSRPRRDSANASDLLRSPGVELPETFEQFLQLRVTANTRQRIRRFERKLAADPDVAIRPSAAATRDADLRAFERLWKRRWAEHKGDKAGATARRYARMLKQALDVGQARLLLMLHNGEPVAAIACYVDEVKRSALFYVGARDPSFAGWPGGLLLHAHMIRWAIEQGFTYYDLLAGDEAYKYSLGARDQLLRAVLVSRHVPSTASLELGEYHVGQALSALRKHQKSAAPREVKQLYEQLRMHCPGNRRVAKQFEKWTSSLG